MALSETWDNDIIQAREQDTEVNFLDGDDVSSIERQIFYESLRDSEVRYELIWHGPLTVILNFRQLIQIVIITRIVHLIIDLLQLATKWKDLSNCLLGVYLIDTFITKVTEDLHRNSLKTLAFSVILFYISLYYALRTLSLKYCDNQRKSRPRINLINLLIVTIPIALNEFLIYNQGKLHYTALRSIFMTMSMKVFSQLDDDQDFLSVVSYFLHPASCLFGPWHEYSVVQKSPDEPLGRSTVVGQFVRQFINSLSIFALTLLVLLTSDSLLDLLDTFITIELSSLSWITSVFFVAQKFRFSHYFMCYLSQSLLALWHNPNSSTSNIEICHVTKIEWPRSLVEVVKFWNIPMSHWLRDHIYTPCRAITTNNKAVLLTFTISASFHGLKFNIWSVLLSLGLLSLIELEVRKRLAIRLDACVLASRCKQNGYEQDCKSGHKRTANNSIMVFMINSAFTLLAITHLSYVGYIFQGNPDQATYRDDIKAWSELNFYSPILAIFTFILKFIL